MKSIMDQKDGICYLCEKLHGDSTQKLTQEHHIFFGAGRRKLSEKYGLKVYLCIPHHTGSRNAVHMNAEMADLLYKDGQRAFIRKYPDLDFMKIFGINYLGPEEIGEVQMAAEKKMEEKKAMAAEPDGFILLGKEEWLDEI